MPSPTRTVRSLLPLPGKLVPAASVFGGGLLGSAAREAAVALLSTRDTGFPTAVLGVNLVGALGLGWFLSRRERAVAGRASLGFWAIGGLGSFTTFSAFSVDTVRLWLSGRYMAAAGYVTASVLGGLLLAWAGQRLGSRL